MMKQAGRRVSVAVATIALAAFMTTAASASGTADLRCTRLLTALGASDFGAATAHFDDSVKAELGPDKLGSLWQRLIADNGRLVGWEITRHGDAPRYELVVPPLRFKRTRTIAAQVAVHSGTGEISRFHFIATPGSRPTSTAAPSAPYSDAGNFHSLDVRVGNSPYELHGILTIPGTASGARPGVLLLGGSGPSDMDESIGPNHPFKDIAEGLSSRGIVVLRYDKRTRDYGAKMDLRHITVKEEYLDDANAAVTLLRSRREVAGDQIFVAGHGLGATIAPEVALKAAPVRGLILLAPGGRRVGAMIVQQMRFLQEGSHEQLDEIARKADELDNHLMPPTENFLGAPASYYYDLDARDEVAMARQLHVPILILHGGRDYQVIDKDIEHWQVGLKGVDHVRVETFPELNHLFMAGTGEPNQQEYGQAGHVDAKVIDAMTAFIENPLSPN